MTALAADRSTLQRGTDLRVLPVAAGKKIFAGAQVVLSATGYAEPGLTATGVLAMGRADEQADNTGGADGAITVTVRRGLFAWANSTGADAITSALVGQTCYVVDDQTVAATNGTNTRSAAGTVFAVDSDGVWVLTP